MVLFSFTCAHVNTRIIKHLKRHQNFVGIFIPGIIFVKQNTQICTSSFSVGSFLKVVEMLRQSGQLETQQVSEHRHVH